MLEELLHAVLDQRVGWFARCRLIDFSLWLIRWVEPCKDEALCWRLHRLADRYARRPTGAWG